MTLSIPNLEFFISTYIKMIAKIKFSQKFPNSKRKLKYTWNSNKFIIQITTSTAFQKPHKNIFSKASSDFSICIRYWKFSMRFLLCIIINFRNILQYPSILYDWFIEILVSMIHYPQWWFCGYLLNFWFLVFNVKFYDFEWFESEWRDFLSITSFSAGFLLVILSAKK